MSALRPVVAMRQVDNWLPTTVQHTARRLLALTPTVSLSDTEPTTPASLTQLSSAHHPVGTTVSKFHFYSYILLHNITESYLHYLVYHSTGLQILNYAYFYRTFIYKINEYWAAENSELDARTRVLYSTRPILVHPQSSLSRRFYSTMTLNFDLLIPNILSVHLSPPKLHQCSGVVKIRLARFETQC